MKRISASILILLLAAALPTGVIGSPIGETPADSKVTVIQNATVLTVTNGTIENGYILIRDGKIAAVGKTVEVPSGAEVIDAKGMYVMPGIIDCHSHIAIEGGVNEGSVSVSSMAAISDVLNPDDIDVYRDL